MAETLRLFNDVNGANFDGLILDTETVVFNPAQIKYTSNKTPTASEDIRYSNRDVDLTAKYPQLNLNEDISELDGVPAIELTDGSVLPITERDGRYPTHVSFIEANRMLDKQRHIGKSLFNLF